MPRAGIRIAVYPRMTNHDVVRFGAIAAVLNGGCVDGDPSTSEEASAIRDPVSALPGQLEGVVVVSPLGCTGSLITNDTVLTAQHCVCDGSVCASRSTASFRDPVTGSLTPTSTILNPAGTVFVRGTTSAVVPTDVAIIKLDTPAPWFVQPFTTARTNPPDGTPVIIAGYGRIGSSCQFNSAPDDNSPPRLNSTPRGKIVDDYDNGMARYYDELTCPGDSGSPNLIDTGGISASFTVFAVLSGSEGTVLHGTVDKSATTAYNDAWIKSLICTSSSANHCAAGPANACACTSSTNIVWRNTNQQVALWQLDGNVFTEAYPGVLPGTFQISGSGDFDGDGFQDLLLRDATGQVQIWHLNASGGLISAANVGGTDPTHQWAIQTVADFDNDGRSDILWRHTSGQLAIWHSGNINTASFPSYRNAGGPVDNHWVVLGASDFDGDGRADILWRNGDALAIWLMRGGTFVADEYPVPIATGSVFQGLGDFNGDGKADILWRMQNGMLRISFGGFNVAPGPAYQNATTNSLPAPASTAFEIIGIGDVDHDGRDDLIWRDLSHNGYIRIWLLDGVRFIGDYQARGARDAGPRYVDASWTSYRTLRQRGF